MNRSADMIRYRVADVDLLSDHAGVINYSRILFSLFYDDVFIPRPPERIIETKSI